MFPSKAAQSGLEVYRRQWEKIILTHINKEVPCKTHFKYTCYVSELRYLWRFIQRMCLNPKNFGSPSSMNEMRAGATLEAMISIKTVAGKTSCGLFHTSPALEYFPRTFPLWYKRNSWTLKIKARVWCFPGIWKQFCCFFRHTHLHTNIL